MAISNTYVIGAIVIMSLATFGSRLVPFAFFSKQSQSKFLKVLSADLPLMIMPILVVYCLKDLASKDPKSIGIELGCLALVIVLHATLRNALLSIFAPSLLYIWWIN